MSPPLGDSRCVLPGNLLFYKKGLPPLGPTSEKSYILGHSRLFLDYAGSGVNGSHRVLKGER